MTRKKVHVSNPINEETLDRARTMTEVVSGKKPESPETTEIGKMIKDLIFIGKVTKDIDIQGFSFRLGTLTEERQRLLISRVMRMTDEEKVSYAKVYTVAEAVTHINGIDIEEVASNYSPDEENVDIAVLNLLGTLQSYIIDILYQEYENLLKESKSKVGYEEVKK